MRLSMDEARRELLTIARSAALRLPIQSKDEFIAQLTRATDRVSFAGASYDAEMCGSLIPSFFFPIVDLDDLVAKTMELLASRGLLDNDYVRAGESAP